MRSLICVCYIAAERPDGADCTAVWNRVVLKRHQSGLPLLDKSLYLRGWACRQCVHLLDDVATLNVVPTGDKPAYPPMLELLNISRPLRHFSCSFFTSKLLETFGISGVKRVRRRSLSVTHCRPWLSVCVLVIVLYDCRLFYVSTDYSLIGV